jgi:hypothetical protein
MLAGEVAERRLVLARGPGDRAFPASSAWALSTSIGGHFDFRLICLICRSDNQMPLCFRENRDREGLMPAEIIRNGSFRDGFEVGYRSIRGTAAGMPGIPGQPGTSGNMTPFLMGVRKGIERGLGKDIDALER